MTIRDAVADDIPVIRDMCDEFWRNYHPNGPYDPDYFMEFLEENVENPGVQIILLDDDLGLMINVMTRSNFSPDAVAHEIVWYTRPEARGRGMMLFKRFKEWAEESGAKQLFCTVREASPAMERMGFYKTEVSYLKKLN